MDGYPIDRRRNAGREIAIMRRGAGTSDSIVLDNWWIVPYNPYLSRCYKKHINVEGCTSIKFIKYMHKYIYKGSGRAAAQLGSECHESD